MFKITRLVIAIAALVIGSTTLSLAATSATPAKTVAAASPAPTATPNPFSYRGYVRAYDFTRQNAYNGHSAANQQSFNAALNLHADYALGQGFTLGGSYLYANPLNGCTTASTRFPVASTNNCSAGVAAPNLAPDDTLPGFQLSTLYEAYAKYKGNGLNITAGDQVYNTPWANASDSRLKPVAFQGVDATYQINKMWAVQASYMGQWECRTCSNFDRGTLLTDLSGTNGFFTGYPGATPLQQVNDPSFSTPPSNGLWYGRIGYTGPKKAPLTANASFYNFTNIAQLFWLDARYPFAGKLKPFVAGQFGSEANPNLSILGKISATVYGLQAGFNPMNNVTITAGFDVVPVKSDNLSIAAGNLPAGYSCTAKHTLSAGANKPYQSQIGYFLMNGAPQCVTQPNGSIDLYYGGLASPYTDSYATDPLFTTTISQGMADRRAPGQSGKIAANFVSDDKRFNAVLAKGWYVYGNATVGVYPVQETNFDTWYYLNKLPKSGPYKGFLVRYRYADRDQAFTFAGGVSLFKYNRFQAEYDF